MVDDTTQKPAYSAPIKRGRPRGSGELGVSRIQGARFSDLVVSRLDRVLLHVFGLEVPQAARSELVRICVEVGLQEIEYRLNSGLSVDPSPLKANEELPPRSSRAHVVRAFRLAGGIREADEQRARELAKTQARRRAGALAKPSR